jgi:hypothetical protein
MKKNRYKKKKLEHFIKKTIEDYKNSLFVDKICEVKNAEKTDGTFTQVGIRPILDEEMFILDNFDSYLPGAGRMVAIGEKEFLIDSLIKNKNIEVLRIKDINKEVSENINFNKGFILLSTKFYVEFFTKLMQRIDYEEGYGRLDKEYQIFVVPERILENRIILLEEKSILWEKKVFTNELTGEIGNLDIIIEPKSMEKVALTIRSLNKIREVNSEGIKILEVNENGKKD